MKGEVGFKEKMHNAKQSKEKKNAKKRRDEFRDYEGYPSSKYGKKRRDSFRDYEGYPSSKYGKGE